MYVVPSHAKRKCFKYKKRTERERERCSKGREERREGGREGVGRGMRDGGRMKMEDEDVREVVK